MSFVFSCLSALVRYNAINQLCAINHADVCRRRSTKHNPVGMRYKMRSELASNSLHLPIMTTITNASFKEATVVYLRQIQVALLERCSQLPPTPTSP